jgi:hypothetical protein
MKTEKDKNIYLHMDNFISLVFSSFLKLFKNCQNNPFSCLVKNRVKF